MTDEASSVPTAQKSGQSLLLPLRSPFQMGGIRTVATNAPRVERVAPLRCRLLPCGGALGCAVSSGRRKARHARLPSNRSPRGCATDPSNFPEASRLCGPPSVTSTERRPRTPYEPGAGAQTPLDRASRARLGSDERQTDDPTLALLSFAGWTSFLKSLASFSGDLSGLTAPPFVSQNASALLARPAHHAH